MAQSPYVLSASVNLTAADERVLIVNLRFMEEVDAAEKARRRVEHGAHYRSLLFSAVAVELR